MSSALDVANPAVPATDIGTANRIPLASGVPLLGSSLALLANPLRFMVRESKRLGPVFRVKAANRDMLVLSGIEANRFMTEEGKDCFESAGFWGRLVDEWSCPHFISAMDGPEHLEERRALKGSISRAVADEQQPGLIDIVHQSVAQCADNNGELSVRELARTLTNTELYFLLTGEQLELDKSLARALSEYQRITFNVLVLGKWPRLALYSPHYTISKCRSLAFVRRLRRQYRKNPPQQGFYKAVLEQHRAHPERRDSDLNFAFLVPFWAGLDTLGASFAFLIQELLHAPKLHRSVCAEIDRAVLDSGYRGIPPAAELRKLPDLFGLCMEILRLYPVGFGNGRRAARDFTFAGYSIPKGQDLLLLTTATHFDPHWFPRPNTFDIERYRPPRNEHRNKYAFNPYGRGPHICLGAAMAESMMLTTVATLLHNYEFEAVQPGKRYPMIFDPSPTLPNAFKVRLSPRNTGPNNF